MKRFGINIWLIFFILVFPPIEGACQHTERDPQIRLMEAAREIMTEAGFCALITNDEEGRARVRIMDPFLPEENFTVWFGTNPKSRKVSQIKIDSRVTLFYQDSDATGYVMIHGNAELVKGSLQKEKYWKESWKNFYPNRNEGYLLIKVVPDWMEIISISRGIEGDSITWQPPIVKF